MLNGPTEHDLEIYKGDDFEETLEFESSPGVPLDLTGWSGKAQCRTRRKRSATLIVEFTVTIPTPANGQVILTLTDTQTEAITRAKGYWDLMLTDDSDINETYAYGEVIFVPTVTD